MQIAMKLIDVNRYKRQGIKKIKVHCFRNKFKLFISFENRMIRTGGYDLVAVLLQMVDELYAEGIPREKTLDLDEEMHGLTQTLLKSQLVMLRRGGSRGRMGHAVHAVFGMRVHRRNGRVLGI